MTHKATRTQLLAALLALATPLMGQDDPTVMRINGKEVPRSEFEYYYNKNNSEGVIDKKTVTEYAQLFVDYRLKVEAALDARLDTMRSFQQEFRAYRDQQIRPMLVPQSVMDGECRAYYDRMAASLQGHDLIQPAHIFVRVPQKASQDQQDAARRRIDSLYAELQAGADFAELAMKHSQDPQTAVHGGTLPWIGPNQTLKEFEDVAYALDTGKYSSPFLSTVGYHIVLLRARKPLESYDELKPNIRKYLESQGLQQRLASELLDSMTRQDGAAKTVEQILDDETARLCSQDSDLRYLIKEYHDGLLLFEECTREVWEPAAKDTAAMIRYFKSHRKQYAWSKPHFRGLVYYCQRKADVKAVKKCIRKADEADWARLIGERFNKDSVTVRVEQRLFTRGDNPNVDVLALKTKGVKPRPLPNFPYAAVAGRVLKSGPDTWTDVAGQVVSDCQREREAQFVARLRGRYAVEIDDAVLKTVNKHK